MSTADAVDREVAWLTAVDTLPSLLVANGGPWSIIQAYATRTPATRKTSIFLMRGTLDEERWGNHRKRASHLFLAELWWPIGATAVGSNAWESEQRALDVAVDLLLQRIRGSYLDHTHGNRFLSVAEAPSPTKIAVRFVKPDPTGSQPMLRADVAYGGDDPDITG